MMPKNTRVPFGCLICCQPSLYTYYGVRCCEGCKQFFRRAVTKQKDYKCKNGNKCELENGKRCLGCRWNKCILAGMEPGRVGCQQLDEGRRHYLQRMNQRRRQLNQEESGEKQETKEEEPMELKLSLNSDGQNNTKSLDLLLQIAIKHKKVWENSIALPPKYLDSFKCIEDLLQFPGNILDKAEQISQNRIPLYDRAKYLENVERYSLSPEDIDLMSVDRLLVVDTFKMVPIYSKLELGDKMAILKHVSSMAPIFWNSYYSARFGAKTWTRGSGLVFLDGFQIERFQDSRLKLMVSRIFCESVEIIKRVQIKSEEFFLLLQILFSDSNAPNLSEKAREMLYAESTRFTRILMNLLQTRLGNLAGATKCAECLHLLNTFAQIDYVYSLMKTYVEVVLLKEDLMVQFPKALLEIDF